MAKLIYNRTKSHGNPSTPASGAGVHSIKITIPNGEKFSHLTVSKASGHTNAATYTLTKSPKANATGKIEIKVMWTNGPFSKCSYKTRVYTDKVTVPATTKKPIVLFGSRDWRSIATSYIVQKRPFKLRVEGPDALKLFTILNPIKQHLIRRSVVINVADWVIVTGIICLTIVAVSGLAVLGSSLLYGINQGCTIKAVYDTDLSIRQNIKQSMDFDFDNCTG